MDAEAEEARALHELAGQVDVLLRRRGIPRWVVVDEDQVGGGLQDRRAEHLPGMDDGRRQAALRHLDVPEEPVLAVEEGHAEHLLLLRLEAGAVVAGHLLRARQLDPPAVGPRAKPAGQLHRRAEAHRLGDAEAPDPGQLLHLAAGDLAERAEGGQERLRLVHGGLAGRAGPEQDRQALGVAQGVRALGEKALARPVLGGPLAGRGVLDAHAVDRSNRDATGRSPPITAPGRSWRGVLLRSGPGATQPAYLLADGPRENETAGSAAVRVPAFGGSLDLDLARLLAGSPDADPHRAGREDRLGLLGPLDDRHALAVEQLVQPERQHLVQSIRAVEVDVIEREPPGVLRDHDEGRARHRSLDAETGGHALGEAGPSGAEVAVERDDRAGPRHAAEPRSQPAGGLRALRGEEPGRPGLAHDETGAPPRSRPIAAGRAWARSPARRPTGPWPAATMSPA